MSSCENQLYSSVQFNELTIFKSILHRREVCVNGNLGREEWTYGTAPLHLAAYYGRVEMVKLLVEAGVKVNSYSNMETQIQATALHYAAYNNHISTVKLLLELGADKTLKGKFGHINGTPLECAQTGDICDSAMTKLLEVTPDVPMQKTFDSGRCITFPLKALDWTEIVYVHMCQSLKFNFHRL